MQSCKRTYYNSVTTATETKTLTTPLDGTLKSKTIQIYSVTCRICMFLNNQNEFVKVTIKLKNVFLIDSKII